MILMGLFGLGMACLVLPDVAAGEVTTAWVRYYDGAGKALAVDSQGNVYVTGTSYDMHFRGDIFTIKYSPTGQLLWVRWYFGWGSENWDDEAVAIGLDAMGNVYVTGNSDGPMGRNFLTIKYSPEGEPLWERRYKEWEWGMDEARSMFVDAQGNVYITGTSLKDYESYYDYLTIKYDSSGDLLWAKRYNSPGNNLVRGSHDEANALTVDREGNVYVTGFISPDEVHCDYLTIKYSPEGRGLWARRYKGPADLLDMPRTNIARAITVDSLGNVYVTGDSFGQKTIEGPCGPTIITTWYDYATIKYSPDGHRLWTRRYNGPENSDDLARGIAVDAQNNIFVTGGDFFDGGFTTIKYGPDGRALWKRRYNGPDSSSSANAICVDSQGDVYITGSIWTDTTRYDCATIKYDSTGRRLWIKRYNGPGNSSASSNAIAVDKDGCVYITGGSTYGCTTIKYIQSSRINR